MILLYASPAEVRYITYEPKICIGVEADRLDRMWEGDTSYTLFGMSGWEAWYDGTPYPCDLGSLYYWYRGHPHLKDMESLKVYTKAKELGVQFQSMRYIIDYNRGRVMPTPFNHLWRKFQHRRMQRKMNELLLGGYLEYFPSFYTI